MRIVVVGSVNLDLVARCEQLPRPGETVTDARLERHPGGKGANQAVAAARLGAQVTFVGRVGNDGYALDALAGLGDVQLSVSDADAPTGVAMIVVDAAGENTIVVAPGANTHLRPEDLSIGVEADAVLCQLEIPLETVRAAATEFGGIFCLNASPASEEELPAADITVVNRHEFELLQDRKNVVAVTLGAEGAILLHDGVEVARAAPPRVVAVDGTAAGDAFTACLLVSHLEGREWDEALRRACAAGALAASRPGAQPSLPTADEIEEILR